MNTKQVEIQAHIAASSVLESIKNVKEINGNELCQNLARNLMINGSNEDSEAIGNATKILGIDAFLILDLYYWVIARVALIEAARAINVQIRIKEFPNK